MGYRKGKLRNPPDGNRVVWCPLCDWHSPDSFATRRRMGEHVSDEHYTEIVFPAGIEPPDLETAGKKRGKNG